MSGSALNRRSRRLGGLPPTSRRYLLLTLSVLVLGLAGASAVIATFAGGQTPPPGLDVISSQGSSVSSLFPSDLRALRRLDHGAGVSGEVRLLASRRERAYYRVGSDCYGVGPAAPVEYRFVEVACAPGFPSQERPVLDFTLMRGKLESSRSDLVVWRSEGIAADGVKSIAFERSAGDIVGRTPVESNVYAVGSIPAGKLIRLLAFDSAGDVVYSQPLVP